MPAFRAMPRLTGLLTAVLLAAACASTHRDEPPASRDRDESPAARDRSPRVEQEPQVTDFRFEDAPCGNDRPRIGTFPGMIPWEGNKPILLEDVSDQEVTIQEIGEGFPPELDTRSLPSLGPSRYVRIAFDGRTQVLILRGVQSQLPVSVGDKVLYTYSSDWPGGGFALKDFSVTLRARDGELLLQYGYLGDLGKLELPSGFEGDTSQELCTKKFGCTSVRAATFRDESGASAQIEPGQARAFSGFDIYVYDAVIPNSGSNVGCVGCFDCRGATIDLLLLRSPE